jgi:fibronectin-binding autotransporter adhesin
MTMKTNVWLKLKNVWTIAAMVVGMAGSAQAATYYWDDNSDGADFGTAGASTGTWAGPTAGPTAGWSLSGTGSDPFTAFTTGTADSLNFGNGATGLGAGTITVDTVSAGNITFASGTGAITLSGGTITLDAAETITVDNATNTISSILAGAATSLVKEGTGALTLSGANTFTGPTTINAGTLTLQSTNMWKTARTYTINGGAVLNLDGGINFGTGINATTTINGTGTLRLTNGLYTRGIASGATITIAMAGGTIDIQSGATLYNGGWQAFSWTNNLASLNVNGTLDMADISTSLNVDAFTGSGTITKTQAGTSTMTVGIAGGSGVFSGAITNPAGATAFTKTGAGTNTLSGSINYTGQTIVNNGTLTLTGNRTVAGGTVTVGGVGSSTLNIQGNLPYALNSGFYVGNNTTGTVHHSTGTVSLSGTSLLLVGNGASNTGTYNLSGTGVLTIGASANRGIMLGVNTGSAGNPMVAAFNMSGGTINNSSLLMICRSDSATSYFNSSYTQTGGTATHATLVVGGNGTSGANSTAALTLSGGTFSAAAFTGLSAGNNVSSTIAISGTAIVTLPAFPTTRGTSSTAYITFDGGTLKPTANSGTYMGGLTSAKIKAGGATFDTSAFNITITQNLLTDDVSTGGGLTKLGTGALTLSGTNTYTGGTAVNTGELFVNGSLHTNSALTVANWATLGGNGTINGTVTASAGAILAPGASAGTAGTLTLTDSSTNALTLNGNNLNFDVLSNDGASRDTIVITGDLVLNGVNTLYINAPLGIAAGSYTIMSYAAKTGSGSIVFPNGSTTMGSLTIDTSSGTDVKLTVTGGLNASVWKGTVNGTWDTSTTNWTKNLIAGQAYTDGDAVTFDDTASTKVVTGGAVSPFSVLFNNTVAYTSSANIGGAWTVLVKSGSGAVTLSGANTFTGNIRINAGTLQIGDNTAGTLGNGNYAGNIINNGTLQYRSTSAQTLSGIISGNGGLTKMGTATLTLGTGNTYTGKTVIAPSPGPTSAGTLIVSSFDYVTSGSYANHGLGSSLGAPTTVANGTIDMGAGYQQSATLQYSGAAATGETTDRVINLIFNSSGTRTLNASGSGLLRFTSAFNSNAAGSGAFILTGTGTGQIDQGLPQLSTGGLSKQGTGTWTLSGNNIFTGSTTLNGGTLQIGVDSVGSVGSITSSALGKGGLTLTSGTLSSDGTTARTILNAVTFGGDVTLGNATQNGALTFSANSTLGASRILTINSPVEFSGVISGATFSLAKAGKSTLTLSGANTYSGGTIIGSTSTTTNMGTLNITHSSALGTGPVSVVSNTADDRYATLTLNSTTGLNIANNFKLSGEGHGTNGIIRNVTGTNTISGSLSLSGGGGDSRIQSDGGSLNLSGAITNGHTGARALILSGSATGTVSGVIANGPGGKPLLVRKEGSGTWIFSNANTYTGATTVVQGALKLGTHNALPSISPIVMGSGTLDVATYTNNVDTLDVTTLNATLNVGTGGAIAFANSSTVDWTGGKLTITGNFTSGSSVRFGTDSSGLTTTQLAQISIPGGGLASIDDNGYLVASRGTLIMLFVE